MAGVEGVRRALKIDRLAIAGNSMGGWVAWNYTLAHPDRTTALVLVDANGRILARTETLGSKPDPAFVAAVRKALGG